MVGGGNVTAAALVDPAVPADGSCARCGKPRVEKRGSLGREGSQARVVAEARLADPFCSAHCCRAWYRIVDPVHEGKRLAGEAGGAAAAMDFASRPVVVRDRVSA